MTTEEIQKYINNATSLKEVSYNAFETYVKEYPYMQEGYKVLFAWLYMHKKDIFKEKLSLYSIYIKNWDDFYQYVLIEPYKQNLKLITAPIITEQDELLTLESNKAIVITDIPNEETESSKKTKNILQFEYDEEIVSPTKKKTNQIISRFIEENPDTRIKAKDTISNEDLSEKSIAKTPEVITETMAKIYMSQKNYTKAIEIYQKISLKNPEKSAYFAEKITEIKKIINNQ